MSISYRKKQLIREAIECYQIVRRRRESAEQLRAKYNWSFELSELLKSRGWKPDVTEFGVFDHPGSDKYVAIKGPIIVKWNGRCGWSDNGVLLELKMYRALKKKGLGMHTPKVYAVLDRQFVVQQYLGPKMPEEGHELNAFGFLLDRFSRAGVRLSDARRANVRMFNGKLKMIDGKLYGMPRNKEARMSGCHDDWT